MFPNWHVLDNEAPKELKAAMCKNGHKVEFTPLDIHRRNIAKHGIQTFKDHCIAVLSSVADNFPVQEWDQLIPQTLPTFALLQQSNVAPEVLAYSYYHGQFNYNRMLLAPVGCTMQFHIKPGCRCMQVNTPVTAGKSEHPQSTTIATRFLSRQKSKQE